MFNRKKSIAILFCLFTSIGFSSSSFATAMAFSDASFNWDTLDIVGDVTVGDPEFESYITFNNDNGFVDFNDIGGAGFYTSQSDGNVLADAGDDAAGVVESVTEAISLFSHNQPAGASSELNILLPFTNNSDGLVEIFADYELFVEADTQNPGDFAFAAAAAGMLLYFIDDMDELFSSYVDISAEAFDGDSDSDLFASDFSVSFQNLAAGEYYLALDLATDAYTEATQAVPAPSSLLLLCLGLFLLKKKSLNLRPKLA